MQIINYIEIIEKQESQIAMFLLYNTSSLHLPNTYALILPTLLFT